MQAEFLKTKWEGTYGDSTYEEFQEGKGNLNHCARKRWNFKREWEKYEIDPSKTESEF